MGAIGGFKLGSNVIADWLYGGIAVGGRRDADTFGRRHSTVYKVSLAPCSCHGTLGGPVRWWGKSIRPVLQVGKLRHLPGFSVLFAK